MRSRPLGRDVAVAVVIALSSLRVTAQQATTLPSPPNTTTFRTPWGEPDLQGIWSAGTITPLERPARWTNRPVLTPQEAAVYEAEHAKIVGLDEREGRADDSYNNIFEQWGGGAAELLNDRRTSQIVDPPDGRVPAFSPEGAKREGAYREWLRMLVTGSVGGVPGPVSPRRDDPPPVYNSQRTNAATDPESRGPQERCFTEPLPYLIDPATFIRIVQSPGVVVLFLDRHQGRGHVRTINIGQKTHLPSHIRLLHGDSIGWWEGNTLVVDTTNFTHKMDFQGARENLHLVERFSRAPDGRIVWQATLEDPMTWTRPWTIEVAWSRLADRANRIYEQSCHEGNFGIIGILAGRRHQERLYLEGKTFNPDFLSNGGGSGPAPIGPDGRVLTRE